jgi:hypothetical protein
MRKHIVAGGSLGALLGVVLGLSTASTVGSVVASLSALLVAFFGLRTHKDGLAEMDSTQAARISSFALCCIAGIVVGLLVRTHQWLSPSLKDRKDAFVEAGFTQDEARKLVAAMDLQALGAKAADDKKEEKANGESSHESGNASGGGAWFVTSLFSDAKKKEDACSILRAASFATGQAALEKMRSTNEPYWLNAATQVEQSAKDDGARLNSAMLLINAACTVKS